jgi:hypothetical protein
VGRGLARPTKIFYLSAIVQVPTVPFMVSILRKSKVLIYYLNSAFSQEFYSPKIHAFCRRAFIKTNQIAQSKAKILDDGLAKKMD